MVTSEDPQRPQPGPADIYAEVTEALQDIASLAARGWGSDGERDEALTRINELALRLLAHRQER